MLIRNAVTAAAKFQQKFLKKANNPHLITPKETAHYAGMYFPIRPKYSSPIALPLCQCCCRWITTRRNSCSEFCRDLSHMLGPPNTLVTEYIILDFIPVFNIGSGKITAEIKLS